MADILLIHGSCHGAWCWRDLIPELARLGHTARAIDLPGHGDDTTPIQDVTLDAYARAVLAASTPDTVVLGHSMGGYAITAAAEMDPANMARLIYLCAYVPQPGLSLAEMRKRGPRQPLMPALRPSEDGHSFTVDLDMAPGIFYHDCTPEQVAYALPRLCAQAAAPNNTAIAITDASRRMPRHYIRCMDDHTIPPEYQVTMTADWPEQDIQEMHAGHSPFLSDPAGLAARIHTALQG